MKAHYFASAFLALLILAFAGCSKSSSTGVNPSSVEQSFANADEPVKAAATRAVNAMNSADYNLAMAELLKLAADPNLTGPQRKAVTDALDQLKNAGTDASKQAADGASNALGDAQKTHDK